MRLDRILLVLVVLIFGFQGVALAMSWDYVWPWIDVPLHLAGGLWLALLFIYIFLERHPVLSRKTGFVPLVFLAVSFVAFIGLGWEIFEYFSAIFMSPRFQFGDSVPGLHFDSLKDLFNDTVGGLVAFCVWWRFGTIKS